MSGATAGDEHNSRLGSVSRMMPAPSEGLFVFSLLLNIVVCWLVASYLFDEWAGRFFAGVAAFSTQVALCAWIPSFFNALSPGTYATTQLGLAAIGVALVARRGHPSWRPRLGLGGAGAPGAAGWALLLVLLVLLMADFYTASRTPIYFGDEANYHVSRAIYQIQHGSVLPMLTHNFRQYQLPFQTELLFLYGVLFTVKEGVGRCMHLLGLPCMLIAFFALARRLALSPAATAAGLLMLAFAPQVNIHARATKPEFWVATFVCGFVCALLMAHRRPDLRERYLVLAACLLVLAVNSRLYALALLPVLVTAVFFYGRRNEKRTLTRTALAVTLAMILMASATGLAFQLGWVWATTGSPFGPSRISKDLRAELSWNTARIHSARFALEMIEIPSVPYPPFWEWAHNWARMASHAIGADERLRNEAPQIGWPGEFQYTLTARPMRFGAAGAVVLAGFIPMIIVMCVNAARRRWDLILPAGWLVLAGAVLAAGILFVFRWQHNSGLPIRFLIAALPLLLAAGLALWDPLMRRSALAAGVVLAIGAIGAMNMLQTSVAIAGANHQLTEATLRGPYKGALAAIPRGSRILFFGVPNSPDYLLFDSVGGYNRFVIPWGPLPIDEVRLKQTLEQHAVSHVFVETRGPVDYGAWPSQNQFERLEPVLTGKFGWQLVQTPGLPGAVFAKSQPSGTPGE